MAEVINLRLARKAKKRADHAATAAENRAKHGQSKAERTAARSETARVAHILDGAKRED